MKHIKGKENDMEINKIHQGDCLELMKDIPDKSVDMILCDLPYGTTKNKWDCVIDLELLWEQYERIIKDNGAIVLTSDGIFTAKLLMSKEKLWRYNLVWDKKRGVDFLNANRKILKSHEDICIFYKKQPTFNKQYWYSTPYKKTKNGSLSDNYGKRESAISESQDGKRNPLSILSFSRDGLRKHPTQKPVELFKYLIKTYSNEEDLVLDNCIGSGTTAVACKQSNRNFIGIEKEQKYVDISNKRLEQSS